MERLTATARWLAWVIVLSGALGAVHRLGPGATSPPGPGSSLEAFVAWGSGLPPELVVFALLRVVVLVLGWYLVVVTGLHATASLARSVRLLRLARLVTLPALRPLVQRTVGLTLVASSAVTAVPASALAQTRPPAPPGEATAVHGDDPLWHLEWRSHVDQSGANPSSERVPGTLPSGGDEPTPRDGPDRTDPASWLPDPGSPATGTDEGRTNGRDERSDEYVVEPGDHLWGIAERTLAGHLGRAPTDREVVPYWRRLIEVNRDRLVRTDDPDLILPGQRFLLPPQG